jgi:hypothetical protein
MGELISGLFGGGKKERQAREQQELDRKNAQAEQATTRMQQSNQAADAAEADQRTAQVRGARSRRGLTAYLPSGDLSDTLG